MGFEILFGCIDADKKSILPWDLKGVSEFS